MDATGSGGWSVSLWKCGPLCRCRCGSGPWYVAPGLRRSPATCFQCGTPFLTDRRCAFRRPRGRPAPPQNPPERNGGHWGRKPPTGAGYGALGQVNNLPQCTVTCPNATAHPPQQCPTAEKLLPLPALMTRCLPGVDGCPAPVARVLAPSLMWVRARGESVDTAPVPVIGGDGQGVVPLCGMSFTERWARCGTLLRTRGAVRRIRLIRAGFYQASAHLGAVARAVLRAESRFQGGVAPSSNNRGERQAVAPLCGHRCRALEGKSRPWVARGLFCKRSRVFKGMPSLCKRYNTCKVWYRCENWLVARGSWLVRTRVPVPGSILAVASESEARGLRCPSASCSRARRPSGSAFPSAATCIGAGSRLLGQVSPHWGSLITCPDGPFPTPMRVHAPIRWPVSYPDAGARPAPMAGCLPDADGPLPQWLVACSDVVTFRCASSRGRVLVRPPPRRSGCLRSVLGAVLRGACGSGSASFALVPPLRPAFPARPPPRRKGGQSEAARCLFA